MAKKAEKKEFVYEMTQEEYDEELAKGWDADDMLSVGKHTFRRSPWAEKLKKAKKIKVSIYLDSEVVHYFQIRAGQPKRRALSNPDQQRAETGHGKRFADGNERRKRHS